MRGIDGVNDGQQIFSYDMSFSASKSDDVKGLFTYQVPALPPGTLMTEETAGTMRPSFMYRLLKNGSAAVTLNTYLGRDYMGSAGRFGNQLSHSIICDFSDFNVYPCEMYAGTALRSRMEFEEVNNPDPPAYLPEPELTRGYVIDTDSVIEFLSIGDNLEYYRKMVVAMLRFPAEKKRLVICDEPDNIAKWIAALHYTMPLDIAKKINFTTYDFDPELSPAQICGVIPEGSRYNVQDYLSSNRHYVFDFINHQFSNIARNSDQNSDPNNDRNNDPNNDQHNDQIKAEGIFMDFLDTAFSFSYDSLTEFHDFVTEKTCYRDCSHGYYAAYYLYCLLSEGIAEITQDEFEEIVAFAGEYLSDTIRKELIDKLTDESEAINQLDHEYALQVLGTMLQSMSILNREQQTTVKQMIVDRLILSLSAEGISEASFVPLYDRIDDMARNINLSIPAEFMVERNRESLLGVLGQHVKLWKVLFIVRIIGDYVKDMELSADELYPDHAIGKIYFGIVEMVYASGRQNSYELAERIIDSFKDHLVYYVNMSLNMEGFLKDLELKDTELTYLWDYFYETTLAMDSSSIEAVNRLLREYDRFDDMYQLYARQIKKKTSIADARDCFLAYWSTWFSKDSGYGKAYAATALRDYEAIYERKIRDISEKERLPYATEILHLAMEKQITEDYVKTLCEAVCEAIPLEKVRADDRKTVEGIIEYQTEVMQEPIGGRLLLLWIAIQLGQAVAKRDIAAITRNIRNTVAENGGARLSGMSEGKIKDYFEWAFAAINDFSLTADDLTAVYELFSFHRLEQKLFMEYWCKMTYRKSKGDKDYADFGEFLSFMFGIGSLDDQDMAGQYLCKLSKQKREDLDREMKEFFKRDRKGARAWDNVKDIAESTNPMLKNLSGLFKRK